MEIERAVNAQELLQLQAISGQALATREAQFLPFFAKTPKYVRVQVPEVELRTYDQVNRRWNNGDRVAFALTAQQEISSTLSANNTLCLALKAQCPSNAWMPELALALRTHQIVHLLYTARTQSAVKAGLEILHLTTTKADNGAYFGTLETTRNVVMQHHFLLKNEQDGDVDFSYTATTEVYVMTVFVTANGVLENKGMMPQLQLATFKPSFRKLAIEEPIKNLTKRAVDKLENKGGDKRNYTGKRRRGRGRRRGGGRRN